MPESARVRFESWKEIADHLRTSIRTAQRWERFEALPVRRHGHARQDTVYAFQDEIDRWRAGRDRRVLANQTPAAEELDIREALAAAAVVPRGTSWRSKQGPVLIRDEETAILHRHLAAVRGGDVRMLCLTGEPGIGKTTLLDQFIAEIEGTRGQVAVFSACSQRLSGAEAFLPILEALDGLTRRGENAPITLLLKQVAPTWHVQVAPLWATADPAFAAVLERAKTASPERLKRELFAFIDRITAVTPLVIAIDDFHWADASTVEMLAYLLTRPELKAFLLLCAYRETEMALSAHPFTAVRHELIRRRICVDVPLRLWEKNEIARYLELAFPEHRFPVELGELIRFRTEGNPFFLCEITRDLVERGAVRRRDGKWVADCSVEQMKGALPVSVQSIIQRKIDQLDEADRRLLAGAALQGAGFDSRVAAFATEFSLPEAELRLRTLESVHALVHRVGEDPAHDPPSLKYDFIHVLYQEALCATLTPTQRIGMSLRIAEALAQLNWDNPSRVAGDLAIFYEAGRNFERAAHWFLQAAWNAAKAHANRQAVGLSERAISNAERLPDPERSAMIYDAATLQAELHLNLSAFDAAVGDFGIAEKAAAGAELIEPRVNAICGAALALFNLKRTAETRALGLKALDLARIGGGESARASAEIVLAMERMCAGDLASAEGLSAPALPILQSQFPSPVPLHVIEGVGYGAALHGWRLEYEQALPPCEWALEKARERGSAFHIVCLLFIRGLGLGNFGRLSDSLADLREGMRLSEMNQERYWLPRLPNTLAWLHSELFDLEGSLRLNLEGSRLAREMNFPEGDANSQINLALNYLSLDEPERANQHLAAAAELLADDEWFRWVYTIRFHAASAQYRLATGDLGNARRAARASLDLAIRTQRRKHIAWARKLLGDIAAVEEHWQNAVRHYKSALSALKGHPCPSVEWKILSALAETHVRLHRNDVSTQLRNRARRVLEAIAESIHEPRLQAVFRNSRWVRDLSS